MPRTKRAARKRCAYHAGNFYANGSMSTTTQPGTVIDSYRPGQERDETSLDDQAMQDSAEPVHSSKRRKAAGGDFYRPSLRSRPRLPYGPSPESDAGDNIGVLGHRRSPPPPPPPPPPRKVLKAEKRQMKLAKIQRKIQTVQRQLGGRWVDAELRLETERLLAGYQADLKAWHDRGSKGNPQKRYNQIRLGERKQSQKALNKARANEKVLQKALAQAKAHETALGNPPSTNRSQLNDVMVTVSDDEEEGGVLLTEASTTKSRNHHSVEEPPAVHSSESGGQAHRSNGKHSETMSNAAHVKLQRLELDLAEAKRLVHIAEVDISYCHFAPLDQQYICLFPTDEYGRIIDHGKKRKINPRRPDPDPEKELRKDLEAGILRTNIGSKPPLWDEIEEKMKAGLFNGLTDTLGLGADEHSLTEVGGKVDALERAMGGRSLKRRPSWMDDDIAPEDLDSESDSDTDDEDDEDSD